jgi:hypothetical protein
MIICETITIPAGDTGYNLTTLLASVTSYIAGPTNRVASLKLCYGGANQVFLVPKAGVYTPVATRPPSYGWDFNVGGNLWEQTFPNNACSLSDFFLSSDTAGEKVQVFAYSV